MDDVSLYTLPGAYGTRSIKIFDWFNAFPGMDGKLCIDGDRLGLCQAEALQDLLREFGLRRMFSP
jgi:hypothetical protein